jgi:hypothetical protein
MIEKNKSRLIGFVLPSALADGLNMLLLKLALATSWFAKNSRLIQIN